MGNEIFDTFETRNDQFMIRARAYKETGYMPGAYYIFESSPLVDIQWKKIMIFRHDDRIPIPREQVRFVNDQIAYLFMGWMYAVTTDGGTSWCVWKPGWKDGGWKRCAYGYVRDAVIDGNGTGVLELNADCASPSQLYSKDYGRTWGADLRSNGQKAR